MAKERKALNTKLYAVIVFFLMAGFLAGVTIKTYTNKYTGLNPEKVALAYVESIVNRGDGYNAYKNSVISKNYKYSDYIREYYMYPVIYRNTDFKPTDSRDNLKGYNDDSFKGEKTLNDTGALAGKVIDKMYIYYEELIATQGGWDNYDYIFKAYFDELIKVRKKIFGDDYMTDEIMFTALEANVSTYGDHLAGTEEAIDENTGVKLSQKITGDYEKAFGEDYKFTYTVTSIKENTPYSSDANFPKEFKTYGIDATDIAESKICTVEIKVNDDIIIDNLEINVVKINSTWYVDNTATQTDVLYGLGEMKLTF